MPVVLLPQDPKMFVGFSSDHNQWVNTVTKEEWQIAEKFFAANPDKVKLCCYEYGDYIQYEDSAGKKIFLKNTFIFIKKEIKAISNEDHHLIDSSNWSEEEIKLEEWHLAHERLAQADSRTKLPARYKIANGDLRHSFIKLPNGEIYALAGLGWNVGTGSYGKVKAGVNQKGEFRAFKIIYKDKNRTERLESEIAILEEMGLLYGLANKGGLQKQRVMCLYLFETNVSDYLEKISLVIETSEDLKEINLAALKTMLLLFNIIKSLEEMHKVHRIIHRDIKARNILVSSNAELNPKVAFCDFGFSQKLPLGQTEIFSKSLGTKKYMAPELNHRDLVPFSVESDIYACGKIVEFVADRVISEEYVNDIGAPNLIEIQTHLKMLSLLMTTENPADRISVENIKTFLIFWTLKFIPADTDEVLKVIFEKNNCVSKKREDVENLYRDCLRRYYLSSRPADQRCSSQGLSLESPANLSAGKVGKKIITQRVFQLVSRDELVDHRAPFPPQNVRACPQ